LLQAVLADPEAGMPKLAFGDALFATGDYCYAVYAIHRGIARVPDLEQALADRQNLFSGADDLQRLIYKLHDFVKQNPSNSNAHFLWGYYLYVSGQFKDAVSALNTARQLEQRDPRIDKLLALAEVHAEEESPR